MTFAQRRNRLTTHFSERIPVVKGTHDYICSENHKKHVNTGEEQVLEQVTYVNKLVWFKQLMIRRCFTLVPYLRDGRISYTSAVNCRNRLSKIYIVLAVN